MTSIASKPTYINKRLTQWLLAGLFFLYIAVPVLPGQIPAFPGAEGAGRFTKGGRGGMVLEVTNLNDSGPGSLREALKTWGARTIVFRVSGTIRLESDLSIIFPNVTIAGQTAPGDGICLSDHQVEVNANEVIIRYLRFRLGDESGVDTDALGGRYRKNVIIDHCSASWSVDETMSFYGIDSLTVQWCIASESLYYSNHPKGAHGYGGIWGGRNASFHHNLLAHHSSRTPRFAGGETAACVNVDFRNNVIYNWGFNSAYGGEGGTVNMVANYYKAGPATKSSKIYRIIEPSDAAGKWYVEDNYVYGSPAITEDNWAGGVQGTYSSESLVRAYTPFPCDSISIQTAEEAYLSVLENAGANRPRRDIIDQRILHEVETGTATYDGYYYEILQGFSDTSVVRGIIDSQNDVGGWPELLSLPAPQDSDHDGMPDAWEISRGLDIYDDSDRNIVAESGYTMLEEYLNDLAEYGTSIYMVAEAYPAQHLLLKNYPNPFNPDTHISFMLPDAGHALLRIYDIRGRCVKTLLNTNRTAGIHQVEWNGLDEFKRTVSSGVYFCVLKTGNTVHSIKINLIR